MHALHTLLWTENKERADSCLAHPFVQGIADGTLDREAFKRYIAQDAFFLRAFRRAYTLALAKSTEKDAARFYELLVGVMDELKLHESYSKTLGIDLEQVDALPACRAYTDFLLRVAWQEGVDVIVAAMAPCIILYAYLGRELAKQDFSQSPYADWVRTYGGEAIQKQVSIMESLLDELASDAPKIKDAYRYAMELELRFFDEPLRG